jgi:transposase
MGYSEAVAREDSSGARIRRGGITKAGNAHRRVIVEAACAYRHRPAVSAALRKRQATASAEVKEITWKGAAPIARARVTEPSWAAGSANRTW